jgi:hypothetical protein
VLQWSVPWIPANKKKKTGPWGTGMDWLAAAGRVLGTRSGRACCVRSTLRIGLTAQRRDVNANLVPLRVILIIKMA